MQFGRWANLWKERIHRLDIEDMKIDICFSPALYPAYHDKEAIVVVVDVFRATTTMAAAFCNGVRSIRPVATLEEAMDYKRKGWMVGAERNVKRCDFADFGNSPFDYTREKVYGRDIAFTTTNGTKAITVAKSAYRVITGAFVNLRAVADYCLGHRRDVVVLCSGWQDKVNIEDTLFGGALTDVLLASGEYTMVSDAAVIAREMWRNHREDLPEYISATDHAARLRANHLEDAIPYCLRLSIADVVPQLTVEDGGTLVLRDGYTNIAKDNQP